MEIKVGGFWLVRRHECAFFLDVRLDVLTLLRLVMLSLTVTKCAEPCTTKGGKLTFLSSSRILGWAFSRYAFFIVRSSCMSKGELTLTVLLILSSRLTSLLATPLETSTNVSET